jgi:maltose O-acetyltransferase
MVVDAQTEREKMIAGQLYRASDPELVTARIRACRLVRAYNATETLKRKRHGERS